MRTSLPPSAHAKKSKDSSAPAQTQPIEYIDLCERQFPLARRIAVLSLIPGLGQFRNGEIGKGILFLTVAATNVGLLLASVMHDQLAAGLTALATAFHRQPNWDLAAPLQTSLTSGSAIFIYSALLLLFVAYAVRDAYDRAVERIRDGRNPERFVFSLPEATSGSYLAHLAVIASFILMVVCFIAPMPQKEQVTQIELIKEEPPKQKAPDKKPPAPKAEAPKPKPVVEEPKPKPVVQQTKPVKVEPPKPTPVAVAVPTDQPTDLTTAPGPVPAAAPATPPAAPAGGTGGNATGAGDSGGGGGGDIDMGPYMRDLQRKIKKAWFPPKGNESKRIKVSFKVHKDGTITKLKLVTSSGVDVADEAATQAVETAAPFAPLPAGAGDEVDINFTFDYTVFSGGRGSFR